MIYFSERDLFSIDLFLADARTGEVLRKITNTATNSHYESLSFITSAGAWDPTGKRFVFPGISKGEPVLTIVDVERGKHGARNQADGHAARSSIRRGRLMATRSCSRL